MRGISKVSLSLCGVDILSGLFLIAYIHRRNVLPTVWKFLLTSLTIADILGDITTVLGIIEQNGIFSQFDNVTMGSLCNDTVVCIVLAAVSSWIDASICLWTAAVGIFLLGILWRDWSPHQCSFRMKLSLCACCWILPLVLNVVALSFGIFGKDEKEKDKGWCDIRWCNLSSLSQILWLLLTTRLWEILAYLTISNIVLKITFKLYNLIGYGRRQRDDPARGSINSAEGYENIIGGSASDRNVRLNVAFHSSKMFFWLPLMFLITRISGSIRLFIKLRYSDGEHWLNCKAKNTNDVLLDVERTLAPAFSICNFSLLLLFHRNVIRQRTVVPIRDDQ